MKLNLWPLFFGSLIPVPFVVMTTIHYGWTLGWVGLCLLVNIVNEIYFKYKHKKLKI